MTNLPITGTFNITATYGQQGKYWANGHKGLDITCANRSIYSTCDGTVRVVGYDTNGWGQYVSIGDAEGRRHIFCHLEKGSVKVVQGQRVSRSTIVGTMGNTGNSTGTHLHYQLNDASNNPVDPTPYLGVPNKKGKYNSEDFRIDIYADDAKIATWAKEAVYNLRNKGIMTGNNNYFYPKDNITRQEIAVAAYNTIKQQNLRYGMNGTSAKYTDDSKIAAWAKEAIYFLRERTLMNGSDNKFRPEENITRQETAILLTNVYGNFINPNGETPYADDSKIAKWAKNEVYAMKKIGVMVGDNNNFNPTNPISRQESAVAINNLIGKL